jgi:hypothetical protein
MKKTLFFVLLFISFTLYAGKDRVFISDASKPIAERETILILPGFGSKVHGTKAIADFFFKNGLDVFIPNYLSRKSIKGCVDNVDDFMIKHNLMAYKKVHVFSYIAGSWTINEWIKKHPQNNICSIVYDRSPLQERAPYALVKDVPIIIRLLSGKIMKEFSKTPYPSISKNSMNVGILIESKATKLIKKHKKSALSLGPVNWELNALKQEYSDFHYTWLDHDDMYTRIDVLGKEILYFFKNGKFTSDAKKEAFTEDPFTPYIEKK